jgi:hypothetical protein
MTVPKISYQDLLDSHRQLVRIVRELREQQSKLEQEVDFLRETLLLNGVEVFIRRPIN